MFHVNFNSETLYAKEGFYAKDVFISSLDCFIFSLRPMIPVFVSILAALQVTCFAQSRTTWTQGLMITLVSWMTQHSVTAWRRMKTPLTKIAITRMESSTFNYTQTFSK